MTWKHSRTYSRGFIPAVITLLILSVSLVALAQTSSWPTVGANIHELDPPKTHPYILPRRLLIPRAEIGSIQSQWGT